MPATIVVPPESALLLYKSFLMSTSLHDALAGGIMNAAGLSTNERWLEGHLGTPEALEADSDDITIWQLICVRFI
jgi:hypothetical protein